MKYVLFTVTSLVTASIVALLTFVGTILLRIRHRSENESEYLVLEESEAGQSANQERVDREGHARQLVHV